MTEGEAASTAGVSKGEVAATGQTVYVAPSPHLFDTAVTTRRMMVDVLIGLAPPTAMAVLVFQWYAVVQVGLCVLSSLAAEALFTWMRGKPVRLSDCSAPVTGVILGLSLPWSAPWYTGFIASAVAIGIGKLLFGGLGQNIFNPAMVGRAFVLIAFPATLGASAYVRADAAIDALTRATPLTAAKQAGVSASLMDLLVGTTNGSLGETSAIACILGGLYLCIRRTASWEIPAGVLLAVAVLAGLDDLTGAASSWTVLHQLLGGALLFGAFFIATDPVS
ncbi:MAG: RnfABCDGE type electron transport complex subunit D, partial [Armatimonadota bacterium]